MAPIKLYHFFAPAPIATLFAIRNIGVEDLEVQTVNLRNNEHQEEWFKKINPQTTLPVLDDNGLILTESRAITTYLASKKGSPLYPSDPREKAQVDQRLYFDATCLFARGAAAVRSVLREGAKAVTEQQKENVRGALQYLEGFLSGSKWVAGPNLSIADFHSCTGIALMKALKVPMGDYPEIQRWFEQFKSLPGFEEMEKGCGIMGKVVLDIIGSWD